MRLKVKMRFANSVLFEFPCVSNIGRDFIEDYWNSGTLGVFRRAIIKIWTVQSQVFDAKWNCF